METDASFLSFRPNLLLTFLGSKVRTSITLSELPLTAAKMQITPFCLRQSPPQAIGEFIIFFKRYRPGRALSASNGREQVALVFGHAVSTHKETWEPVLQNLFALQNSEYASSKVQIVETWSMDYPNHGESAEINEKALQTRNQGISGWDLAHCMNTLLKSGLIGPRKVIAIGHSASACILYVSFLCALALVTLLAYMFPLRILVAAFYSPMDLPYTSLIIVEPTMMTKQLFQVRYSNQELFNQSIIKAIKAKRDVWGSREEARSWLRNRVPWKSWQQDAFDLFTGSPFHALTDTELR
jgi:hypothetical protein